MTDPTAKALAILEDLVFNTDKSRAYAVVPFGIACYERAAITPEQGGATYTYTHRGTVATVTEAESWLLGDMPDKLVPLPVWAKE